MKQPVIIVKNATTFVFNMFRQNFHKIEPIRVFRKTK